MSVWVRTLNHFVGFSIVDECSSINHHSLIVAIRGELPAINIGKWEIEKPYSSKIKAKISIEAAAFSMGGHEKCPL